MNNMHMRTGLFFVSILAGFTQPVLSASLVFEDNQRKVSCGQVEKLTVTSNLVTAKGSISCLTVSNADTPTAAPQNLGTVDTGKFTSENLTNNAVVKLPVGSVAIVAKPKLPGASVAVSGSIATYYAPNSDQITASANDSFTYTITDATKAVSTPATASVYVNWVKVKSDGCTPSPGIVCMGPTPAWPVFHEAVNHVLYANTTHVWSFVYESKIIGQIGAVLSTGAKNLKISDIAGDTKEVGFDCWRDFGDSVLFEPAGGGDKYRCDLVVGKQYYFNIKNMDSAATKYQLKGDGDY